MQRIFEAPEMRIAVFDCRDTIVTESIVPSTTAEDNVRLQLMEKHQLKAEQIIVFNE